MNTVFGFPGGAAVPAPFSVQRDFLNYAPEAGLLYRLNEAWQFRGRASTGYGTPTISNLTVTAAGVSGNNSQLASQTNVGLDVGADFTPNQTVKLSVTGFYEFFRNELVTQSPGDVLNRNLKSLFRNRYAASRFNTAVPLEEDSSRSVDHDLGDLRIFDQALDGPKEGED